MFYNHVYKNLKANIAIGGKKSSDSVIFDNLIEGSCCEGIFITHSGITTIYKNKIKNNYDGIIISKSVPDI